MIRHIRLLTAAGIALAGVALTPCLAIAADPPLETVKSVDLDRYLGRWYEIARYPNRFQSDCAGEVTATYLRRDDGDIEVDNACLRSDGSVDRATGIARVADPSTNAKLEVLFAPPIIAFLPFVWGDYWVIDLASDYSYAVVGEPSREFLWILSRSPSLDESVMRRIRERLPAAGYDPAKLVSTVPPH